MSLAVGTVPHVLARHGNVVMVDFNPRQDPPGPPFPGAGALRPPNGSGDETFVQAMAGRAVEGHAAA